MEDDLLLNRPSDRRLLDDKNIYPGPPGADPENKELEELDKWKATYSPPSKKKSNADSKSRRGTNAKSRSRERSRGRNRRSRSGSANRRSRRYGGRDFNKDKTARRSRSHERTSNRRSRSRGRENSRDRERYRRGGGRRTPSPNMRKNRWSSKQSPTINSIQNAPPNVSQVVPTQYVQPPQHMFNDGYGNYGNVGYGQTQQAYNTYDNYGAQSAANFAPGYPPPPPVLSQPIPPGDDFSNQNAWGVPPPPIITNQPTPVQQMAAVLQLPADEEDKIKREAAVALEMQNQRQQLKKQRADYQKRASALKRELKILKEQRDDLASGSEPPSPTTKGFIKENDRLQSQITNKLSTIENVIDMLSGIIGTESVDRLQSRSPASMRNNKEPELENEKSTETGKPKLMETINKHKTKVEKEVEKEKDVKKVKKEVVPDKQEVDNKTKINYVHYDPEMHWCKNCDVFPKTAKDYLNHLHSKEHLAVLKGIEDQTPPWHTSFKNDEIPSYPNATKKRTPIRGLQFFIPSTAWFCNLCAIWMGDLRCASMHLKSLTHAEKYTKYIEQNPHFEVDWMADRQKAYEHFRDHVPPAPAPPLLQPPIAKPSLDAGMSFESIPLQIINQPSTKHENEVVSKRKKRDSEKDTKKDKKKKKKSKKRRQSSSSSSSSSSSDSTDTDSDKGGNAKDDKSNSIRVAMRNLLKSQTVEKTVDDTGRWTVIQPGATHNRTQPFAPPPPTVSVEGKKKDDIIISQWATPEAIITASEKKLLEDLKGKLKKKTTDRDEDSNPVKLERKFREREPLPKEIREPDHRDVRETNRDIRDSRDIRDNWDNRDPRDNRDIRGRDNRTDRPRSRDRDRDNFDRRNDRRRRSRSRSSSRSRSRRSRSRSPINRRYRRRQFSRSRSRPRVIEKPIVNYPPEPKPRPERKIRSSKNDDDGKKSPSSKKSSSKSSTSTSGGKKLPFIGRMPVFKKQVAAEIEKKHEINPGELGELMTPGVQAPPPSYTIGHDGVPRMLIEDDEELMPDPAQLMAIMATAPPPPPMTPMPRHETNEVVLPPGVDENEADAIPKPISDAPRPRKGPLPKDFQDALNIIFPGEKKPDTGASKSENKGGETQSDIVAQPLIVSDQQSNVEIFGGYSTFPNPPQVYQMYEPHPSADLPLDILPVPPPPPVESTTYPPIENGESKEIVVKATVTETKPTVVVEVEKIDAKQIEKQMELDDLAMLGIDADDLAAQCM